MRTTHYKILDAETRGNRWLADANELTDRARAPGLTDAQRAKLRRLADRAYASGQFWLDRYNKLTGRL